MSTGGWIAVQDMLMRRAQLKKWKNGAVLTDHCQDVLTALCMEETQVAAKARLAGLFGLSLDDY